MVGQWMQKNPLTLDERIKIKEALDMGLSYQGIGQYVGRAKSVVMREIKRFKDYDPEEAEKDFIKRAKAKKEWLSRKKIKDDKKTPRKTM